MRSDPTLKRLFNDYNRRYFGGALPRLTVVRWHDDEDIFDDVFLESLMGVFWPANAVDKRAHIILHRVLHEKKLWRVTRGTLLHEMVHLKRRDSRERNDHGVGFQTDMKALVGAGAYKDLW